MKTCERKYLDFHSPRRAQLWVGSHFLQVHFLDTRVIDIGGLVGGAYRVAPLCSVLPKEHWSVASRDHEKQEK